MTLKQMLKEELSTKGWLTLLAEASAIITMCVAGFILLALLGA